MYCHFEMEFCTGIAETVLDQRFIETSYFSVAGMCHGFRVVSIQEIPMGHQNKAKNACRNTTT